MAFICSNGRNDHAVKRRSCHRDRRFNNVLDSSSDDNNIVCSWARVTSTTHTGHRWYFCNKRFPIHWFIQRCIAICTTTHNSPCTEGRWLIKITRNQHSRGAGTKLWSFRFQRNPLHFSKSSTIAAFMHINIEERGRFQYVQSPWFGAWQYVAIHQINRLPTLESKLCKRELKVLVECLIFFVRPQYWRCLFVCLLCFHHFHFPA